MGLFGKTKAAHEQAAAAMTGAGSTGGSGGGPAGFGLPNGNDIAAQAAYAQMANKLSQAGVQAPAVIDDLRPTGQSDISGGQMTEVGVTITPNGGVPYQTTIRQTFLPSQLEGLSPGLAIGIKYDPDNPSAALIYSW
jgi:hypothetical protein